MLFLWIMDPQKLDARHINGVQQELLEITLPYPLMECLFQIQPSNFAEGCCIQPCFIFPIYSKEIQSIKQGFKIHMLSKIGSPLFLLILNLSKKNYTPPCSPSILRINFILQHCLLNCVCIFFQQHLYIAILFMISKCGKREKQHKQQNIHNYPPFNQYWMDSVIVHFVGLDNFFKKQITIATFIIILCDKLPLKMDAQNYLFMERF